jgi:hypothetical protein
MGVDQATSIVSVDGEVDRCVGSIAITQELRIEFEIPEVNPGVVMVS